MLHILKILAVIIVVSYSLHLVNAQSDIQVFCGLAIVGSSFYYLLRELNQIMEQLKSKL